MMCGLSRDGFCSWSESCPKQRTEAHLFDAKQLQRACLAFIKENVEAVANTPGFLKLTTDWPEVMLKVTLFNAGLCDNAAHSVVEAQREALRGLKRKRFE
ncbi:BTB/POZ and MATH domain-containing protein 3 [Durusdinium trenchii]|uniref:BTB/POZ and MATH domain-containing protein 3 n=1 Tax=Durusdinium trenchii TaxID=1381693 RepID=A0ABP0S810_9DINO